MEKYKLLIVNIERVGWENKVLEYIESPTLNKVEYHLYKRDESKIDKEQMDEIYKVVNLCLENIGYSGKELIVKDDELPIDKYNAYL